MTRIIVVRHGESAANNGGTIAGQMDVDLSELGLKQAELVAKYIAKNYKVDKIYSSDLQRAYKTALAIGKALNMDIVKTRSLREIYAGIWEGMKYSDIKEIYADDYKVWTEDIGKCRPTGGESAKELGDRVMAELNKIKDENENKTVVAVTHATVIRAAQTIIELGNIERMQEVDFVSNASVNILEFDNGKWEVKATSIDSYLADMRTIPILA